MWKVTFGDRTLYQSGLEDYVVYYPVLTRTVSKAGEFTFSLPYSHPMYGDVSDAVGTDVPVVVYRDGAEEWRGRMYGASDSYLDSMTSFTAEGDLAMLNDVVMPLYRYSGKASGLLRLFLDNYNASCDPGNHIYFGGCDIPDNVTRWNETPKKIWEEVSAKTVESDQKGYLVLYRSNGNRYLKWTGDPESGEGQPVKLGLNLLELTSEISTDDLITAIMPYGTPYTEDDSTGYKCVSIWGYGTGYDDGTVFKRGEVYLVNRPLYDKYGFKATHRQYSDPALINSNADGSKISQKSVFDQGAADCRKLAFEGTYKVTAVDMSLVGFDVASFEVGQVLELEASNVTGRMIVSSVENHMDDPAQDTVTLGPLGVTSTGRGQSFYTDAVMARTAAESAQANANAAKVTATDAKTTADNANSTAATASEAASAASDAAAAAKSVADDAASTATTASTTAALASTTAATAKTTAETAKTTAETAKTTAHAAKTTAQAASTNAAEAKKAAAEASSTATTANANAKTAQETAEAAKGAAAENAASIDGVDKRLQTVETDYITSATLKATQTTIEGKVSSSLTEAKKYADDSVATEVTNRDAAIKASADSITSTVSETYITKDDASSTYATQTSLTQTSKDLTARIDATDESLDKTDEQLEATYGAAMEAKTTADATATLVRAYNDGVLVCKTGNTVGALVNADGSFDVRSVTWDGDTPTASSVLASFDDNGLSFAGDGDSFLHHDADNDGLQLYGMKYNALRTYVKEETQASVEAVGLSGTPEVVLDAHDSNAVQTTVTVKPDGIVIFDSSKLVVDGSTGTVTDDGCRKLADWITDSRIETGVWAIPQSTTKQTAVNATGWSYELYASGKVHMWGIVANGSAACTQLFIGVYRETANQYIALPVKVRYIRSMTYGGGLPGFLFGVGATSADNSAGCWSDSGLVATGYRFIAHASGTYAAASTIDIWAQV